MGSSIGDDHKGVFRGGEKRKYCRHQRLRTSCLERTYDNRGFSGKDEEIEETLKLVGILLNFRNQAKIRS